MIAYGESANSFLQTAKAYGYKNFKVISKFDEAIIYALKNTGVGVLLFSPACASFDQFNSYEERGNRFNQIVKEHNS